MREVSVIVSCIHEQLFSHVSNNSLPAHLNTAHPSTLDDTFTHDVHRIVCSRSYDSAVDAIMRYEIFPPWVLSYQIDTNDGRLCEKAIITQWFHLPLIKIKAFVRVIEVREEAHVTSVTYVTTTGHPECGVARFEVRRVSEGVEFTIETWSKPGSPLSRIGRPFMRWMQKRSTAKALELFCR